MNESYLVSVVIPCFNVENYLDACIESIIGQTYNNLQIVIINDGSKDSTPSIIQKWAEKDCRIEYYDRENVGIAETRNFGIDRMKGDFLCFVDADDMLTNDCIEKMLSTMIEFNADLVCCALRRMNKEGELKEKYNVLDTPLILDDPAIVFKMIYSNFLFKEIAIRSTCKLYKKEIIHGVKYPVGRLCEDAWASISIYSHCAKMVFIPDDMYYYRDNPNSIMNNKSIRLIQDEIAWMEMHLEYWQLKNEKELVDWISRELCYYLHNNRNYMDEQNRMYYQTLYVKCRKYVVSSKYLPIKTRLKYFVIRNIV